MIRLEPDKDIIRYKLCLNDKIILVKLNLIPIKVTSKIRFSHSYSILFYPLVLATKGP